MADSTISSERFLILMQALGHINRLRIVECLGSCELDVQSLQNQLLLGQSTVSQHLAILRSRNIVKERRAGRHVFYKLVSSVLMEWLLHGVALASEIEGGTLPQESIQNKATELDGTDHPAHD